MEYESTNQFRSQSRLIFEGGNLKIKLLKIEPENALILYKGLNLFIKVLADGVE
jgi:hypothetical protein